MWNTSAPHVPPLKQKIAILVFTGFYFIRWFYPPIPLYEWAINIGGFAIFLVCYFLAFNVQRWTLPCALTMVVLSVVVAPYNNGANIFAIYACSFFAYFLPARTALLFIGLTILALAGACYFFQLNFVFYFVVGAVPSIGIGISGVIDRQRIQHEKRERRSQEEVARLAKIAERERIGQDLHDVVGHALTAIHLKIQLAIKQLEQDQKNPALANLQHVQQLSQNVLQEIRQTIAGIKKQSLEAELEAQRDLLNSLGLIFTFQLPPVLLPAPLESDLLLIVRETMTNILRHAKATQCSFACCMEQDVLHVTIRDNGIGMVHYHDGAFGNGLQGIRQRVTLRRGSFDLAPAGASGRGLKLDIRLPLTYNQVEI